MLVSENTYRKILGIIVFLYLGLPGVSSAQSPFTVKTGQHPRVFFDAARIDEIRAASVMSLPLNGSAFPQTTGTLSFDIYPTTRTDAAQSEWLAILDGWDSSRNHIFLRHQDAVNPADNLTWCDTNPADAAVLCLQMALQSANPNLYIASRNIVLTANQWHTLRVSWDSVAHTVTLQINADTPIALSWRADPGTGIPYEWQPDGQNFSFKGRDGLDNIRVYSSDAFSEASLLVDYPMDDASGLVVSDASGSGDNAKITSGVIWGIRSGTVSDGFIQMNGGADELSVSAAFVLSGAWRDFYADAVAVAGQVNSGNTSVDVSVAHPSAILNISRKLGLAYLVTSEALFLTAAQKYADQLIAVSADLGGDYTQAGRIEAMGILYDWFFTDFGSAQHISGVSYREALVVAIKSTLPFLSNFICGGGNALDTINWDCTTLPATPDAVGGHSHQNNTEIVAALLAVVDEYPELQSLLHTEHENFINKYNPVRAWISVDGGHHMGWDYGATYTFLDSIQLWNMATTDVDMRNAWQGKLIDRYIYGLRGDMTFPASGDAFRGAGITPQSEIVTAFALWGSQYFANTAGQNFYNRWIEPGKKGSRFNELLFWQPNLSVTPIETLEFSRWFRNSGQVVMRDSWDYLNATLLEFKSTSFRSINHHHLDQNAFTLFYKAPLLVDSGYYDSYGTEHWHNYFTRTVAHNTLTVFDPLESFNRSPTSDPVCCSNDGGQAFMTPGNPQLVDIQSGGSNHLDGIMAYQYTADFTFTRGNASKAYSSTKLEQSNGFVRDVVFIRNPVYWQKPVTVVFDKVAVVTGKENLTKRLLFHMVNEPEPLGGAVIAPGQYLMGGNLFTVRNGAGMLFSQTVLPENPIMTKIGGNDMSGDYRFSVPDKAATDYSQLTNFTPNPDPAGIDADAGAWRVEITAQIPSQKEYFLHVLSVADESPGLVAPAVQNLSNNAAAVVLLGQSQVVVFNKTDTPATAINWDMPIDSLSSYLITGVLPNAAYQARLIGTGDVMPYRVVIEQSGVGSFTSSSEGVITIQAMLIVDTDNDGVSDSIDTDDDNDGLSDIDEAALGTNPFVADTDSDGVSDGLEVAAGTNPLSNQFFPVLNDGDANNDGVVNTADLIVALQILIGQRSATPLELAHLDVAPLVSGMPSPDGAFGVGDYLVLQRKVMGVITF